MPVEIQFLANVNNMLRDLRRGRTSLEEVGHTVDEVRREGVQNTERLERSFVDLADSAKRVRPRENLGRPMKEAAHEADEGVRTMRENIGQNLKETASSFDGTWQSAAGGAQGLLAEITEGFGPAGILAGVLGAGALGLLSTQLQHNDEQAQSLREHIADMTASLIDAGGRGATRLGVIAENLHALATESDPAKDNLDKLAGITDKAGQSFELFAQVTAGDTANLQRLQAASRDRINGLLAERDGLDKTTDAGKRRLAAIDGELHSMLPYQQRLNDVSAAQDKARHTYEEYARAGGPDYAARAAAAQSYADSIQGTLAEAGTSWDKFAGKEGGLSLDKYEAVMSQKANAIKNYEANVAIASGILNDKALSYIESLGVDAAPLLAKFVRAPLDQQDRIAGIWATLGDESGAAFNTSLQDKVNGYRLDPLELTVVPVLHKTKFQHMMDALTAPQYVDVVPRKIARPGFGSPNP